MSIPEYIKLDTVKLQGHPTLSEKWVHDRIANDPAMLGLGDLILRDKERRQPGAGRLDLLLHDGEDQWYEVEIQLGRTDESHIMRTIEYWDIERKRSPQCKHCGVIVAEEITSRFFNVISLFNGAIPLIAIQMRALEVPDRGIALVFTTVLSEQVRSPIDEEPVSSVATNRKYWEQKSSPNVMRTADGVLQIIQAFSPSSNFNYKQDFIGLLEDGGVNNYPVFLPQKERLLLTIRLDQSPEVTKALEDAGVDFLPYSVRDRRYRLRLAYADVERNRDLLSKMLGAAHDQSLS